MTMSTTTVQDILKKKGHDVVSVEPETTVLEAARQMNDKRIGAVVVFDAVHGVTGMFTERDVLMRVVGDGRSPEKTPVREVMSSPVTCCKPATTVEECQSVMTSKRLRHLPVIEDGKLVGMVSVGDVVACEVQVQQTTIEYLHEYLHGRT